MWQNPQFGLKYGLIELNAMKCKPLINTTKWTVILWVLGDDGNPLKYEIKYVKEWKSMLNSALKSIQSFLSKFDTS